ncbi:rhomboid family intramembrane serine protease [Campylobacter sp. MG1]|uniref:rhomboid family intramembrane serine protease n=1 Tax=Campylobacter sp. MG1 TaxID=2976332 RepID=UPI00226CA1E0|nr:rhomboid family intramembrane serine protease [Campylobacter sp. MG1]
MIVNFALHSNSKFYTFVTYAFLHSDLEHIIMNMSMLLILSQFLKYYNQIIIFLVYISGAIISALLYYYLMNYFNQFFILVGASGAIYTLFGFASYIFKQTGFLIATIITSVISVIFFENIAWQAHIFGFIYGYICAYLLKN